MCTRGLSRTGISHPDRVKDRGCACRAQRPSLHRQSRRNPLRGLADFTVDEIVDTMLYLDLILVDEVGLVPLDKTGTRMLFRFVAGASEGRSLAIASKPFEQGPSRARTRCRQHPRSVPALRSRSSRRWRVLRRASSPTRTRSSTRLTQASTHRGGDYSIGPRTGSVVAVDRDRWVGRGVRCDDAAVRNTLPEIRHVGYGVIMLPAAVKPESPQG